MEQGMKYTSLEGESEASILFLGYITSDSPGTLLLVSEGEATHKISTTP